MIYFQRISFNEQGIRMMMVMTITMTMKTVMDWSGDCDGDGDCDGALVVIMMKEVPVKQKNIMRQNTKKEG